MTAMTDFLENELLDHVLATGSYTAPAAAWASLHTTATTDAAGGTEVAGNGYARQSTAFGAASGGVASNSALETFGPNTTSDWGTVTHGALWDASTVGNMLVHGALTASRAVAVDDTFEYAIGAVDITFA